MYGSSLRIGPVSIVKNLQITFTFREIGKLLVIAAVDDVASNAVVSTMALDLGLIPVKVFPGFVNNVSVLNFRESEALFFGTRG